MDENGKRADGELDKRGTVAQSAWTRCQERWRYGNPPYQKVT